MRLVSWSVEGYRNLSDVSLDVEGGVVIAGKNNAGKSNILRSLADYSNLFGESPTAVPDETHWDSRPTTTPSETEGPTDATGPVGWDDWFELRESEHEESSPITFTARFRPAERTAAAEFSDLPDDYTETVEAVYPRAELTEDIESIFATDGCFDWFEHELRVDRGGIESERLLTNFEGEEIVVAARTDDGDVREVYYEKIEYTDDGAEYSSVSDLTPDEIDSTTVGELASGVMDGGDRIEDPDSGEWYYDYRDRDPYNLHGGVFPGKLIDTLRQDLDRWTDVPAVRDPSLSVEDPAAAQETEEPPELGDNLANVVEYLKWYEAGPEDEDEITNRYTSIIDEATKLFLSRGDSELSQREEDDEDDVVFSGSQLSTGSLQIVCLLSALHAHDERGSVITVEEPETHLHPESQRLILEFIEEFRTEETDPIITTHSETFIDQSTVPTLTAAVRTEPTTELRPIPSEAIDRLCRRFDTNVSDVHRAQAILVVPTHEWRIFLHAVSGTFEEHPIRSGVEQIVVDRTSSGDCITEIADCFDVPVFSVAGTLADDPEVPPLEGIADDVESRTELDAPAGTPGHGAYDPVTFFTTHADEITSDVAPETTLPDPDTKPDEWIDAVSRELVGDQYRGGDAIHELVACVDGSPTEWEPIVDELIGLL